MKRIVILLLAALGPVACGAASEGPVPKTTHPMKIGIIGTGEIGGALAREIGPNVKVGTPREAATFGDVVLISVPYSATPQIGRDYAAELKGKVVLDTGNPYPSRDGEMAVRDRKRGTGVASAEYLPGTRLVRAFNAINSGPLANQAFQKPERLGIPLAADDPDAMKIAEQLVRDAGFDPVAVGPLARAREFDVGTPVYVRGMTAVELRRALKL